MEHVKFEYSQIYIINLKVAKRLLTALSHVFRLPRDFDATAVVEAPTELGANENLRTDGRIFQQFAKEPFVLSLQSRVDHVDSTIPH
jgi:hypothetical protein